MFLTSRMGNPVDFAAALKGQRQVSEIYRAVGIAAKDVPLSGGSYYLSRLVISKLLYTPQDPRPPSETNPYLAS